MITVTRNQCEREKTFVAVVCMVIGLTAGTAGGILLSAHWMICK
jgi:uncharacterized protein YneF (UPF0154 family)